MINTNRKPRSIRDIADKDWEKFKRIAERTGRNQGHLFGELINHKCTN